MTAYRPGSLTELWAALDDIAFAAATAGRDEQDRAVAHAETCGATDEQTRDALAWGRHVGPGRYALRAALPRED